MPRFDRLESTTIICSYEKEQGVPRNPVIVLTENVMFWDKERCLQTGMDDFLLKPVTLDEVQAMLAQWFEHPTPKLAAGM